MDENYVISIKAFKNPITHKPCEEWLYAGVDDGFQGTGYPCWRYFKTCKKFSSIESAEEWFNKVEKYLFETYYDRKDFDMSTFAIRKVTFKNVKSLSINMIGVDK